MPSGTLDGLGAVQPSAEMPVTAEQASKLAQQYLDAQKTGLTIEEGPGCLFLLPPSTHWTRPATPSVC